MAYLLITVPSKLKLEALIDMLFWTIERKMFYFYSHTIESKKYLFWSFVYSKQLIKTINLFLHVKKKRKKRITLPAVYFLMKITTSFSFNPCGICQILKLGTDKIFYVVEGLHRCIKKWVRCQNANRYRYTLYDV